jgi:hypothetical protein
VIGWQIKGNVQKKNLKKKQRYKKNEDWQCTYNTTLRSVRAVTVAVEQQ